MTPPAPLTGPFLPTYPIETERLRLRPIDPVADVDGMQAYRGRADVCRYIPPEPMTREQLATRLTDPELVRSALDHEGQALSLVVDLRETGELIGDVIFFWRSSANHGGEIG